MAEFILGNGADYFSASSTEDFTSGSVVRGLNGDDTIEVMVDAPLWKFILDGGRGDDIVRTNAPDSHLIGGSGDDYLEIVATNGLMWSNILDGGNGDDLLRSFSRSLGLEGNNLIGGSGEDTFVLDNVGYIEVQDNDGSATVSDGDVLRGPWDTIADYQSGEIIDIVPLDNPTLQNTSLGLKADSSRLIPDLPDDVYSIIRGNVSEDSGFIVDGAGSDLLVVYDIAGTPPSNGFGAFVLQDYIDVNGLVIV